MAPLADPPAGNRRQGMMVLMSDERSREEQIVQSERELKVVR
jgi:hypothetical protein